jgi:predicted RNase H-like HicB family nuclease
MRYPPGGTPRILWVMRYTAIFEVQPDGGYHVMCPALPGCHSEGDTLDQADRNIRGAIAAYLESLQAHGEDLPVEDILIRPLDVAIASRLPSLPPV